MKKTIDVNYIQLIDGAFELEYVLTDFLSDGSVHSWWKCVKVSNYNSKWKSLSRVRLFATPWII